MSNLPLRQITISLETADIIRRIYLPRNPSKARNAAPAVIKAVREFIAAVEAAQMGNGK